MCHFIIKPLWDLFDLLPSFLFGFYWRCFVYFQKELQCNLDLVTLNLVTTLSNYFSKTIFRFDLHKKHLVTLSDLVTVFEETKCVTKSRVHCNTKKSGNCWCGFPEVHSEFTAAQLLRDHFFTCCLAQSLDIIAVTPGISPSSPFRFIFHMHAIWSSITIVGFT